MDQPLQILLHRLAHMTGRTVREVECTMSYKELLGWADYWARVEPYPEVRQDLRNALLCKLVSDIRYWFAGKKSPTEVSDFVLQFGKPKELPRPSGQKGANISSEALTGLFVLAGRKKRS